MLRNGIRSFIGVILLTSATFSDEPASKSTPQKQRVSPKLLKEALALPEFAERTQEVPPVSLDDLKRLAQKLKTSGDIEGAELLQRFVQEHERVAARAHAYPGAQDEKYNIQCDVLEVNIADLPPDCKEAECTCQSLTKVLEAELHRLVKEKKAKAVIEHVQIPIKAYETGRARSGGELPVPIPSSDGKVALEFREFGTIVETTAIPLTKDRVKIQVTTDTSAPNPETVTTLLGTTVPGITKRRAQSTVEANLGETVVQTSPTTVNGRLQFVLVKVTSTN